ncbi:PucR family transcriptional regulator [Nonomuraea sp. NPDC050663]|uniref:PucR family transcriptional regulator n=1 Tax=Nonomuraea sp. NPDC050663 TaxID=3364370 RepID=UPI0037B976C1
MSAEELAAAIAARCETRVNSLTREIVAEHEAVLPGFAELHGGMLEVETASTTRHGVRLFLRVAQGRGGSDQDMRLFRERAAQRMSDGVRLTTLLSGYAVGYRAIWRMLCEETRQGEEAGLHRLGELMVTALERTMTAVCEAYLLEAELAQRGEAMRAVAGLLLQSPEARAGVPGVQTLAAQHGITLESSYRVLAFALQHPGAPPAVRRRRHAVQGALDRLAGQPVLTLFDQHTGHALLPGRLAVPTAKLGRRLVEAAGPLHAGLVTAASLPDIPATSRQAARIAQVAAAYARPPGVYELGDVLVEFHLSTPGPAAQALSRRLVLLEPSLVETLEAFFAADFDRRATAAALTVHPNTVDNRLARVAEALQADPRTAGGILLVGAALAVRRLEGFHFPQTV